MAGVWASAEANMATYLMLKERAAAYRADPEVQAALEDGGRRRRCGSRPSPRASRSPTCSPTGAPSRTSTSERAAEHGFGFVRLNQLALEHLLGAR